MRLLAPANFFFLRTLSFATRGGEEGERRASPPIRAEASVFATVAVAAAAAAAAASPKCAQAGAALMTVPRKKLRGGDRGGGRHKKQKSRLQEERGEVSARRLTWADDGGVKNPSSLLMAVEARL